MRAAVRHTYGPPAVIGLEDVPRPVPGDDEVLVRVHAASVNSWDFEVLLGTPFITRMGGLLRPKHAILGADIAGTVESVGPDVADFVPGDEVFGDVSGRHWGGFADYVAAEAAVLAPKPSGVSFEEAAALPQAGVLALQGLRWKGRLTPGRHVAINGAGGGGGSFAVQLAKADGAEVTAIDSAEKHELLRTLGADHFVDYKHTDFTAGGERFDFILDLPGHHSILDYRRALKPGGTYVMVGGSVRLMVEGLVLAPAISLAGSRKMGILLHRPRRADLETLGRLVASGSLRAVIDRIYPLEQTSQAIQYVGDGHAQGKVIVTP